MEELLDCEKNRRKEFSLYVKECLDYGIRIAKFFLIIACIYTLLCASGFFIQLIQFYKGFLG